MRSADFFHCTMGGVVSPLVELGQEVERGQPVVQIRDLFGREVEVVRAPTGPSVLLAIKTYGTTNGGAPLGILGVKAGGGDGPNRPAPFPRREVGEGAPFHCR